MLPRRSFLRLTGAAALAPPGLSLFVQDDVPLVDQVLPMLDHILLGCSDLQHGIDFVEQRTGVRAAFGGVHPGRGTQNALFSLGALRYLEIIAPDPQQNTENPLAKKLQSLPEPRLVGWAAHPGDIAALAAKLKQSAIVAEGPTPGSRKRPDGKVLHWQTLALQHDPSGLLPFFIEWGKDTIHPSTDAPSGCQLLRFELRTPDPAELAILAAKLTLGPVIILKDTTTQLRAKIIGPKAELYLTS